MNPNYTDSRYSQFQTLCIFPLFISLQEIHESPNLCVKFYNILTAYGDEQSFTQPTNRNTTPFFACLSLLIQQIHNYPPHLEDVFSTCNLSPHHAIATRDSHNVEIHYISKPKLQELSTLLKNIKLTVYCHSVRRDLCSSISHVSRLD